MMVWANERLACRSQEVLAVQRTELGRAMFNMRLSTATPTAASARCRSGCAHTGAGTREVAVVPSMQLDNRVTAA